MNNLLKEIFDAIKQSGITLKEWLDMPCLPEDLLPLPWDTSIQYLPIDKTRFKFDIMQECFGATVEQIDVRAGGITTHDKDTCFWADVKFIIHHESFPTGKLFVCGTASFLKGQYKGWSFTQIAESIATTRAFSKQWKQFGRDLNKDIDSITNLKSPDGSRTNKSAINNTMQAAK